MTRTKLAVIALLAASVAAVAAAAGTGEEVKRRRPPPAEYGREVIQNHSAKAGLAPVVFEHWLHRSRFTCRLCHVDVGFAMKTGATDIRASDNAAGQYCGACHNGKTLFGGKKVFEACLRENWGTARTNCVRCHSLGKDVKPERDFASFAKGMPRGRFGNGIDWEKAEEDKLIQPADFLEGVSIKRAALTLQRDFALSSKIAGMPDIIFSHTKHTVWNGCEVCHPDIFVGVKRGTTKYTMVEIFDGKYCGVCHQTVAFPLIDCQRCHSKPVQ